MKRQVFAILDSPDLDDEDQGAIVEIVLDDCGGLDGLIMMPNNWAVQVLLNGYKISVDKDQLKDFWIV